MSILDGDLAEIVADALADADVPRDGVLRRVIWGESGSGEPIPVDSSDHAFTGWRENYSTLFAAQSGFPATDVRILVVAKSCDLTPVDDDYLQIGGVWHLIRTIERIDPAGATIACQCLLRDPSV